jgi:hypothetical protein
MRNQDEGKATIGEYKSEKFKQPCFVGSFMRLYRLYESLPIYQTTSYSSYIISVNYGTMHMHG